MYLSHAVRTIRDDPMADESVDLVVTLADDADDPEESEAAATDPEVFESTDTTDPDESEAAATDPEAFESAVVDLGGEVVADLQFSAAHVRLPETAVADLCDLGGIDRIETAATLRLVGEETAESAGDSDGPASDDATRRPDHDREQ
jgi:hypothetical protein